MNRNKPSARSVLLLIFFALMSILSMTTSAGSVRESTVSASGEGRSYQQALNQALLEAIAQVNGKLLDSTKITLRADAATVSNEEESYYSTDAYQSLVRERTNGAVSGYEIVQAFEDAGLWQLEIVAQVATFQASDSAQRKRIVIVPAETQQGSFSVLNERITAGRISARLDQSISDFLTGTRKFAVLDRQSDAAIQGELALAASELSPTNEAARLGEKLVADFVLVGVLEAMQYAVQTKQMRSSDREYSVGSGTLSYRYRLIEVATSQVFFSDTLHLTLTHDQIARSDRTHAGAISQALVNAAASKVVGTLTSQIYPLAIIARQGDEVILSEGGKSLRVGDQYKVYQRGKKIYDPYTKEFSGFEEYLCCTVQVTRIAPKQSYAILLHDGDRLPEQIPERTYVLRDKVTQRAPAAIKVESIDQNDSNW